MRLSPSKQSSDKLCAIIKALAWAHTAENCCISASENLHCFSSQLYHWNTRSFQATGSMKPDRTETSREFLFKFAQTLHTLSLWSGFYGDAKKNGTVPSGCQIQHGKTWVSSKHWPRWVNERSRIRWPQIMGVKLPLWLTGVKPKWHAALSIMQSLISRGQ